MVEKEGGRGGRGGMGNNNQPTVVICELIQTTTSYEYILLIPTFGLSVVATKLSPVKVVTISCNSFLPTLPPTQCCLSTVAIVLCSRIGHLILSLVTLCCHLLDLLVGREGGG